MNLERGDSSKLEYIPSTSAGHKRIVSRIRISLSDEEEEMSSRGSRRMVTDDPQQQSYLDQSMTPTLTPIKH